MANNRIFLRHRSTNKSICLAHQFRADWELSINCSSDLGDFFAELGYVPAEDFYLEIEHPYEEK